MAFRLLANGRLGHPDLYGGLYLPCRPAQSICDRDSLEVADALNTISVRVLEVQAISAQYLLHRTELLESWAHSTGARNSWIWRL
jgi:hypothetical protein